MSPDRPDPIATRPGAPGRLLLLVLVTGLGLNCALIHPLRNTLPDFRGYYAAGQALHHGVDPYDVDAVRTTAPLPGSATIVPYFYPPPTLALFYVISLLPYAVAQVVWGVLQYTLLLASLALLLQATRCPLGSPTTVLIAFVFLTSASVQQLFFWGQFDMLPLLLLAAAFTTLHTRRPGWAGALIGAAAVAKVTPLLCIGVLLLRRERRALMTAILTIALSMGLALAVLGPATTASWWHSLGAFSRDLPTLFSPTNMSLQAWLYRTLVNHPANTIAPVWNLGLPGATLLARTLIAATIIITAVWMLRRRRALTSAECLAVAVPVVQLASPVTWPHHGVLLLIPLVLAVTTVMNGPRLRPLHAVWLTAILLLYINAPLQQFGLTPPAWIAHLAGPTTTYATTLLWLFLVTQYVPLKQAAGLSEQRNGAPASTPAQANHPRPRCTPTQPNTTTERTVPTRLPEPTPTNAPIADAPITDAPIANAPMTKAP